MRRRPACSACCCSRRAPLAVDPGDVGTLTTGGPETTTVPSTGAADLGRVLIGLVLVVVVIGVLYA